MSLCFTGAQWLFDGQDEDDFDNEDDEEDEGPNLNLGAEMNDEIEDNDNLVDTQSQQGGKMGNDEALEVATQPQESVGMVAPSTTPLRRTRNGGKRGEQASGTIEALGAQFDKLDTAQSQKVKHAEEDIDECVEEPVEDTVGIQDVSLISCAE